MAVGEDLFKQCLRRWASGVTIVTSRLGDEIHGMTVSAFSSVSAEPPLVLVCANKKSKTHAMISSSEIFNVHVLASNQGELSNRFASQSLEGSRFESVEWRDGKLGAPILAGALASLECRLVSTHEPHDIRRPCRARRRERLRTPRLLPGRVPHDRRLTAPNAK